MNIWKDISEQMLERHIFRYDTFRGRILRFFNRG